MNEAHDPIFWRLNAEELRRVADELETTLAVLDKYDMKPATDIIRMRIGMLRGAALKDILYAVELERK